MHIFSLYEFPVEVSREELSIKEKKRFPLHSWKRTYNIGNNHDENFMNKRTKEKRRGGVTG